MTEFRRLHEGHLETYLDPPQLNLEYMISNGLLKRIGVNEYEILDPVRILDAIAFVSWSPSMPRGCYGTLVMHVSGTAIGVSNHW